VGNQNPISWAPALLSRNRGLATRRGVALVVTVLIALGAPCAPTRAAELSSAGQSERGTGHHVVVTLNKSRTFRFDTPITSAVVGSPEIADVLPMSDRSIYIQGKKVGSTNVSVFDQSMRLVGVVDVDVAVDAGNVESKIRASTDSRGIRVSSNNGEVVLSGEARDAATADRAVSLARGLNPDSPVVNAMRVAPSQQVMLKVRFLEAGREATRELGFNWFVGNNARTRAATIGTGTPVSVTTVPGTNNSVSGNNGVPLVETASTLLSGAQPFGVVLANLVNKGTSIDVLVSALETKGLIRRLAEPDLVALSGDTASFLAGGEIPVPIVQPGSTGGVPVITVDYKPFGVQLTFVPTVLANGIINLRLAPSVSALDFAQAVQISGFTIPAITKREARTTVELRDGQSFAIAGLLNTEGVRNIDQIPWLGSVPVLGALFRSSSFQQRETDLVVIVTPHLVVPATPGQRLATPFDERLPSNDADFFLLGETEVRKRYTDYVSRGGDLQGPYGHMIRVEQGPN
jgi:pilus assembly protein CpaC